MVIVDIYRDDEDRKAWLTVLGKVGERFNWVVHAYCQMSNHYHIIVETRDGNLSRGMRQLKGYYTQSLIESTIWLDICIKVGSKQ